MGARPQQPSLVVAIVCTIVAVLCFAAAVVVAALSLLFAVAVGREYGPDQGIPFAVAGLALSALMAWVGSRLLNRARRAGGRS